jgi:hypothetical protein
MTTPAEKTAPTDLAKTREATDRVKHKLATDPNFAKHLLDSPRETLQHMGVHPDHVNHVIGQTPAGDDGLAALGIGCITTECCFSIKVCCGSGSC